MASKTFSCFPKLCGYKTPAKKYHLKLYYDDPYVYWPLIAIPILLVLVLILGTMLLLKKPARCTCGCCEPIIAVSEEIKKEIEN